ncbi:MAG: hypothetical protein ACI841_001812 [Planctomycetota bacterium]|jgi:hypothetical protein
MNAVRKALSVVPRPDLSGNGKEVVEFRLRAHDGTTLWGLLAKSQFHKGARPAEIRVIGPSERPEVDKTVLEDGIAQLIFQEPAGRRLPDRVLDVLRIAQMALATDGIDHDRISFCHPKDNQMVNEVIIAEQLLAGDLCK